LGQILLDNLVASCGEMPNLDYKRFIKYFHARIKVSELGGYLRYTKRGCPNWAASFDFVKN
jgi:hypothetical protein